MTYKEAVNDVNATKYTIEGLTVSNAAVKQSDSKTVVLTTSAQEGGKKYTVKSGDKALGQFDGISAVVPTKIDLSSTAVQGVVGKEVTLKADIGQKTAGVPVTFNVEASNSINKNHVEEVLTDANGIATYSYTQYSAGYSDDVAVYPTGAPSTRAFAKVFWGVDQIISLTADDKKDTALNNGENKVYKVVYKDAKTGQPVAGQKLNVTFAENINVNVDKLTKATVNGVNPYQLLNGDTQQVQVTTKAKGEATFTVSGANTKATPVVFTDVANSNGSFNGRLDAAENRVYGDQLTFAAQQNSNDITITRDGGEEAATGLSNGRTYKVAVKTKDGKAAAGEILNIGLNEIIDRDINTNTKAEFTKEADDTSVSFTDAYRQQITLKLDSKGEGKFTIATGAGNVNDYATPIAWLDINSSNASNGKLDDGETFKLADKTYFAAEKITTGTLTVLNDAGKEIAEDKYFKGTEAATFKFEAANQSGNAYSVQPTIKASYTVVNTGTDDIKVYSSTGDEIATISPNRSETVTIQGSTNYIKVKPAKDSTTSVRVEANATTVPASNETAVYLGNQTAKASFSKYATADIATGTVTSVDVVAKTLVLRTAKPEDLTYKYKDSIYQVNGQNTDLSDFESQLVGAKISVTKGTEKNTFNIVTPGSAIPAAPTAPTLTNTTKAGGSSLTISTVPTNTTAWLAPTGTTNFVAGNTMTSAAAGASAITTPTAEGTYKLFLVDNYGRVASSTGTLTVDNTAPISTITSATYTAAADTLVLTGTNFDTAAVSGDVKGQLDWSKITWDIDGDGTTTPDVTFVAADIDSATVTNSTTLTIVLKAAKALTLEGNTNYNLAGTNIADTIDVAAGFIKDAAGNVATTDAKANAPLTIN